VRARLNQHLQLLRDEDAGRDGPYDDRTDGDSFGRNLPVGHTESLLQGMNDELIVERNCSSLEPLIHRNAWRD
jgi:hypothetical protein